MFREREMRSERRDRQRVDTNYNNLHEFKYPNQFVIIREIPVRDEKDRQRVDTNYTNLHEFKYPNQFVIIREIRVNSFPFVLDSSERLAFPPDLCLSEGILSLC